MKPTRSLANSISSQTILAVVIAVTCSGLICIFQQYSDFKQQIEQTRQRQIAGRKALLKRQVDDVIDYIDYQRRQAATLARQDLRAKVEKAWQTSVRLCKLIPSASPDTSRAEIIREFLRCQSFNGGRGYFFAFDMDGTARLDGGRPGSEGQKTAEFQSPAVQPAVRQMLALVRKQGQGFCTCNWPKAGEQSGDFPKLAYVKYLAPLQWVIGAGIYLDDVEKTIQQQVLNRIKQIRFGEKGYFFIGRWDGHILLGPATGRNMLEATDPNGVKIVKELIARARAGGGFVSYVIPALNGQPPLPKISYARAVADWQWYVGAGVYLDDIQRSVLKAESGLKQKVVQDMVKIVLLVVVLLAVSLLLVRRTNSKLKRSFDLFSSLFSQAAKTGGNIDARRFDFFEFHQLARSANKVLEDRRKAEKQYRQLVENASSVILRWDATGRITYINPYGRELFGYREDELTGRSVMETIVPPQESSTGRDLEKMIADIIADPDSYVQNENENITKDGRRLWISWNNRGIFDPKGKLVEILSIGHDLTDKKALEARLAQAQKMEAIGTLAGSIAHDFNNSLQAILGYIQLIINRSDISRTDLNRLKQVEKAARKAGQLTRQLLTFSRKTDIRIQRLNLNHQIRETSLLLKRTLSAMIEIKLDLAADLWPIKADAVQIEQILMNMGINARDAMPHGGRLTIASKNVVIDRAYCRLQPEVRPGRYVELTVSDTGQGMDKATVAHIFEPFFTTKEKGKGTGLGLATVYGIVKSHGGHITVYSEPGKGSRFRVCFPAVENDEADQIRAAKTLVTGTQGRETVLLVDDEQDLLEIGSDILEGAGYSVITAENGLQAVSIFSRRPKSIDLVILDIVMPKMSGVQCLQKLRQIDPGIKVILTSGYAPENETEAGLDNISAFIQKPYQMYELLELVRKVLDN